MKTNRGDSLGPRNSGNQKTGQGRQEVRKSRHRNLEVKGNQAAREGDVGGKGLVKRGPTSTSAQASTGLEQSVPEPRQANS